VAFTQGVDNGTVLLLCVTIPISCPVCCHNDSHNGPSADVQIMPRIKNSMFGGGGLFVTTLRGQGTAWLQGGQL
jgi:hypothetical protein